MGRLGIASLVGLCLLVPGAASAGTVSGKLAKGAVPAGGEASVRAVDLETAAVLAGRQTKGRSFSLALPSGRPVGLFASAVTLGRPGTDGLAKVLRTKKRAQRGLKLRVRKRNRRRAAASARAGYVDVAYPALWIKVFDESRANALFKGMGRNLVYMLTSDLSDYDRCPEAFTIVERLRLDAVLAEQELSRSPRADPRTRVREDRLIEHNTILEGELVTSGPALTINVRVSGKRVGTASVSGPYEDFFALEQQLVEQIYPILCRVPGTPGPAPTPEPGAPKPYSGTVSGARSAYGTTVSWSGTVTMAFGRRHGTGQGGAPPGDYDYYRITGGSLRVVYSRPLGICTYYGETDVAIEPQPYETSSVQSEAAGPWYYLAGQFGAADKVTYTKTGPPADCTPEPPEDHSLAGMWWMYTPQAQQSASRSLSGSADQVQGPVSDHWEWSLAPGP